MLPSTVSAGGIKVRKFNTAVIEISHLVILQRKTAAREEPENELLETVGGALTLPNETLTDPCLLCPLLMQNL